MQVKLQIPKVILYVGNFVNKSFDILYIGFIEYDLFTRGLLLARFNIISV